VPTSEYPYFITGDIRGGLRIWPVPRDELAMVADEHFRYFAAIFNDTTRRLVATGANDQLVIYPPAQVNQPHKAISHLFDARKLADSPSHTTFAAYGDTNSVELWDANTMDLLTTLNTDHGTVTSLHFLGSEDKFVTGGSDGKLTLRSIDGGSYPIAAFDSPIQLMALAPSTQEIIATLADNSTWAINTHHAPFRLSDAQERATTMSASSDGFSVYIGRSEGTVIAIDTRTMTSRVILRADGAIHDIVSSREGTLLGISDNSGHMYTGLLVRTGITPHIDWSVNNLAVRYLALADDLLIAPDIGGKIWLHSLTERTWICVPTGPRSFTLATIAATRSVAYALDADGHIFQLRLTNLLNKNHKPTTLK
jgi:WD40 repeat protein